MVSPFMREDLETLIDRYGLEEVLQHIKDYTTMFPQLLKGKMRVVEVENKDNPRFELDFVQIKGDRVKVKMVGADEHYVLTDDSRITTWQSAAEKARVEALQ